MSNPLLSSFDTPFNTPPFHLVKNEHYLPAVVSLIESTKEEIENVISNIEAPTFENTIEGLENTGRGLDAVAEIFFNLNSAETNDEMQQLAECSIVR